MNLNSAKVATLSASLVFLAAASWAAVMHASLEELLAQAEIVAVAETISVNQAMDGTQAQLRLVQVFKGPRAAGELVAVETQGGKVYINEDEPSFHTMQMSLVFLQNDGSGHYRCVNQGDGMKEVSGKSIYPYHDNPGYSVDYKDYLKSLEAAAKAGEAQKPSA